MTTRPIYVSEIKGGVSLPGWIAEHVETRPGGLGEDSWIFRTVRETFANERVTEATFRFVDGSFVTYSVEAPVTECGFCDRGKITDPRSIWYDGGRCPHCDGTGLAPQGPPEQSPRGRISE